MKKRTQLALLIVLALLLIAFGVWMFLKPLRPATPAQPPALPTNVQPVGGSPTSDNGSASTTVTKTPEELSADAKMHILENRAKDTVSRIGSGTSVDGFLGYNDVFADMTASGRTALVAEQQAMQRNHPPTTVYGITTHSTGASEQNATYGDASLLITVQAVQQVDAGNPSQPVQTKAKSVGVTFLKQADGSYLIDKIAWSDVAL